MITQINNAKDCIQMINENLHGILTKTRTPIVAKEVNNSIGKMIAVKVLEFKNKEQIGDRTGLRWFDDPDEKQSILVRNAAQKKSIINLTREPK